MTDFFADAGPEISRLVRACLARFYAAHAPNAADRLAARHAALWEHALAGAFIGAERLLLAEQAAGLGCAPATIAAADAEVIWNVSPVMAASLACGPGDERICLHEVGEALVRLLAQAEHGAPYAQAA